MGSSCSNTLSCDVCNGSENIDFNKIDQNENIVIDKKSLSVVSNFDIRDSMGESFIPQDGHDLKDNYSFPNQKSVKTISQYEYCNTFPNIIFDTQEDDIKNPSDAVNDESKKTEATPE